MQNFSITTILLRKATEYVMSSLLTFEKVKDPQYSPYHTTQGVKYHIPEPDYYHTNTQPKQYQKQQNQNVYLPPPHSIEDICTWYGRGRGRARCLELHGHRLYGEKTKPQSSFMAGIYRQWSCLQLYQVCQSASSSLLTLFGISASHSYVEIEFKLTS